MDNLVPKDLIFNSETADDLNNPQFVLTPPVENVVGYSINQVAIPFTYYVIDRTNNHFRIVQKGKRKAWIGVSNLVGGSYIGGTFVNTNVPLSVDLASTTASFTAKSVDVDVFVSYECYLEPGTYSPETLALQFKKAISLGVISDVVFGNDLTVNVPWVVTSGIASIPIDSISFTIPFQARDINTILGTTTVTKDITISSIAYRAQFTAALYFSTQTPTNAFTSVNVARTTQNQLTFIEPTNFEFMVDQSLVAQFYHKRIIATDPPLPFYMDFSETPNTFDGDGLYKILGFTVTPPTTLTLLPGKWYASAPNTIWKLGEVSGRVSDGRADLPLLKGYEAVKLNGDSVINLHSSMSFANTHRDETDKGDIIMRVPTNGIYGSIMTMPGNAEMIQCSRDTLNSVRFNLSLGNRSRYYDYDKEGQNTTGKLVPYLPLNGHPFQVYLRLYVDDGKVLQ